jgi:hypothetical protein
MSTANKSSMTLGEIEQRVKGLVAQGIDCTQWAMSHGYALSETPTVNPAKHTEYWLKLAEQDRLAAAQDHTRKVFAAAGQLHAAHEFNNGKSDAARMKISTSAVKFGGQAWDYTTGVNVGTSWITSTAAIPSGTIITCSPNSGTITYSQEQPVVISGKQFVVVCNGRVEYADDKIKAGEAAERLAHANQQDAFVLAPISRTAPKRDVVTTAIKL